MEVYDPPNRTRYLKSSALQPDRISGICSAMDVGPRVRFPKVTSSSGQAYAPEKILKARIRAISVKNRVDGEVTHPNSVIFIGSLQPFECVLFLI